ncbi:MAG: M23 family metallopeptidase [Bacteroidales bacterium]|nr:M23 family metallopeptidase [Bacteroidales bacterium]
MKRGVVIFLLYAFMVLSLSFVAYAAIALFVSTDTERNLMAENRTFRRMYSQMLEKESLLKDEVAYLQTRDAEVYRDLFSSRAPYFDPSDNISGSFDSDTIPETRLERYAESKVDALSEKKWAIERNFLDIFKALSAKKTVIPPMRAPLDNLSYAQVGASVGEKINPAYKVRVRHNGLDFPVAQGTEVKAAGNGVVTYVAHSNTDDGNVVEITHAGGFVTRYAHLGSIRVSRSRFVRAGDVIGTVGMSGASYAPHLHYEIIRNGIVRDPVDYLFGTFGPDDYAGALLVSSHTEQSMD